MKRNKVSSIILGVALILAGLVYAGNVLNVWDVSIFFDGWWTLFIIIPCVISMINSGVNTSNTIGVIIGAMLLLNAQRILPIDIVLKLLIPVILVAIGIKLLFRQSFAKKIHNISGSQPQNRAEYSAYFGEQNLNYNGLTFEGTNATVIFGSMNIDLRGANIPNDCVIDLTCIFGGIDIISNGNINIKSNCLPIFGGVTNKSTQTIGENVKTIYLNGTCIFGGVEVK